MRGGGSRCEGNGENIIGAKVVPSQRGDPVNAGPEREGPGEADYVLDSSRRPEQVVFPVRNSSIVNLTRVPNLGVVMQRAPRCPVS